MSVSRCTRRLLARFRPGHRPGCGLGPAGGVQEAAHRCFSLTQVSLSLLPLPPSCSLSLYIYHELLKCLEQCLIHNKCSRTVSCSYCCSRTVSFCQSQSHVWQQLWTFNQIVPWKYERALWLEKSQERIQIHLAWFLYLTLDQFCPGNWVPGLHSLVYSSYLQRDQ